MLDKRTQAYLVAAVLLCCWGTSAAQDVTLLLPERTMEMGVLYRRVHRDLGVDASARELDYSETSLVGAYGLTKHATLSAEFMIGDENFNSIEYEVRYYLLGAGIQALLWKHDRYILSGGVGILGTLLVDRTGTECDENHHEFTANAIVQTSYLWRKYDITPWLGVGYQYYLLERESGDRCSYFEWFPEERIGVTAGVNVLLYERFHLYGNFLYIDYAQPRFGVSYRF